MDLEDRLVLEPECRELSGLHPCTRYRLERQGKFPKRFKIGDPDAINGRIAWSRAELTQWLANRMAARTKPNTTVTATKEAKL